jgi:eukaryotic-like serine/threonine-protein kinase
LQKAIRLVDDYKVSKTLLKISVFPRVTSVTSAVRLQGMFRIYSQHKPGDLINRRYRLTAIIGEGALGRVFRAEDTKFNPPRPVAVKILHAALVRNEQARLEIRQEAGTLAQLNHPGILTIYDYEVSRALTFLVMELATGGSLQDKLNAAGTLPYDQILRYLETGSAALDYAHAAGLLHRDIKPQNILLNAHGLPVLADFSLGVKLESDGTNGKVGEMWGTAEYAAPEVWRGEAERASDVYALGVVLYQLCSGEPPYTGDLANLQWQHEHAAVPPLSKYLPRLSYPPGLDKLFAEALAKNPARRPASALELYNSFKSALTVTDDANATPGAPSEADEKTLPAKRNVLRRVRDKFRLK